MMRSIKKRIRTGFDPFTPVLLFHFVLQEPLKLELSLNIAISGTLSEHVCALNFIRPRSFGNKLTARG